MPLTHLLTEPDLDAFRAELLAKADVTVGTPACATWQAAVELLDKHRSDSFQRRCKLIGYKPRKTLGLRLSR